MIVKPQVKKKDNGAAQRLRGFSFKSKADRIGEPAEPDADDKGKPAPVKKDNGAAQRIKGFTKKGKTSSSDPTL